jgi:23S rRNA (guanosine2251-2'-O)-methyltransferase
MPQSRFRPKDNRRSQRPPRRDGPRGPADRQLLWGLHTVEAALANPERRLLKLTATENAWRRLTEAGIASRIEPDIKRPQEIDRMLPQEAVHQGVLLEAEPLPGYDIEDVPDDGVVLVLDQVTDPHNVGAILRSAAAFAARALVMTNRHSPEATGVLAKAASGALEHVPLCLVQNLNRALAELAERGFQTIGLDSEAETALDDVAFRRPVALVLGAEGKGLRQSTRASCDIVARLDLPGPIGSLNVSNAAVLALSAADRATRRKGAAAQSSSGS